MARGGINTRAVMSQNIVAICDCDTTLLEGRLQAWKTAADRMAVAAGQDPTAGLADADRAPAPVDQADRAGPADRRRRPGVNSRRRRPEGAADARWPAADQNATLQRFANEQLPRLKKYQDYREMFEKQKDIDAVIIATPDHMHGADRVGRDGARQARLRAEADVLVGG